MRAKLTTAFSLTALFSLTAILPVSLAYIGPPPPTPEPGWSALTTLEYPLDSYQSSMASRSDGTFTIVGTSQRDSVTNKFNLSYAWKNTDHHAMEWVAYGLDAAALVSVATTDQDARAGVYGAAALSGPTFQFLVAFVGVGGSVGSPVSVSDTRTVAGTALAATPQGNVMAVWSEFNGSLRLWANHSSTLGGWDGSVLVANLSNVAGFDLVPIGADDFVLVWGQDEGAEISVMAARYAGGTGWGSPAQLAPPASQWAGLTVAGSPQSGRGAVAISSGSSQGYNVTVVPFSAAGGFGTPSTLFSAPMIDYAVTVPQVALDGNGATHVMFAEGPYTSAAVNLTYRQLDPAGGWQPATTWRLPSEPQGGLLRAAPDGTMAYAWTDPYQDPPRIMALRYLPDGGWRGQEFVDIAFTQFHRHWGVHLLTAMNGGNLSVVWANSESYGDTLVLRDFIAPSGPPVITITSPAPTSSVTEPTVLVAGTVSPVSRVSIDGVAAAVAADGSFSARVALDPGTHLVEVFAVDEWGNGASASVNVTFTDPVARQLGDTQVALAEAWDELNTSQDQVDALEAAASEQAALINGTNEKWLRSQLSLNLLSDELNLTNAQLNESKAAVQQQQSDIEFLRSQAGGGNALLIGALGVALGGAGVAMSMLKRGRGGGGAGSKLIAHEATHTVQQGKGVEVRGWDPKEKEPIAGSAQATGPDAKEFSPAEEQLKGNPRH